MSDPIQQEIEKVLEGLALVKRDGPNWREHAEGEVERAGEELTSLFKEHSQERVREALMNLRKPIVQKLVTLGPRGKQSKTDWQFSSALEQVRLAIDKELKELE